MQKYLQYLYQLQYRQLYNLIPSLLLQVLHIQQIKRRLRQLSEAIYRNVNEKLCNNIQKHQIIKIFKNIKYLEFIQLEIIYNFKNTKYLAHNIQNGNFINALKKVKSFRGKKKNPSLTLKGNSLEAKGFPQIEKIKFQAIFRRFKKQNRNIFNDNFNLSTMLKKI